MAPETRTLLDLLTAAEAGRLAFGAAAFADPGPLPLAALLRPGKEGPRAVAVTTVGPEAPRDLSWASSWLCVFVAGRMVCLTGDEAAWKRAAEAAATEANTC